MFEWARKEAVKKTKKYYPKMAANGWLWVGIIKRGLVRSKYREIRKWAGSCSFKSSSVRIYWSLGAISESEGVGHSSCDYAPVFVRVRKESVLKELGAGKKAFRC